MAEKLDAGTDFPALSLDLVDGRSVTLPAGIDTAYQILLFYRGHW